MGGFAFTILLFLAFRILFPILAMGLCILNAITKTSRIDKPEMVGVMKMENDIQKSLEIYKEQLSYGDIQAAYVALIKCVAEIKSKFPKEYHTGNISCGYLDYSYFPFFNEYLRSHKLRFGVVLNHEKLQFELWLMGQNADVQKKYWNTLKSSKWNINREEMPRYSVLEVVLENQIDFADKDSMIENIIRRSMSLSLEIQEYLERIDVIFDL